MTQAVRQPGTKVKDVTPGEMQSTLLRVHGIFRTGIEGVDANVIHLPLSVAQTLLGVPDQQVTQVALFSSARGRLTHGGEGFAQAIGGGPG